MLTGDEEILRINRKINLMEGAIWTEQEAGTNAVGTAIIEQRPMQIVGGEHFCTIHHGITCSGSPIFGVDGELEGVINMSANSENVHPHTLGMVVASAKAIENQLKIEKAMEEISNANIILNSTLESVPQGILNVSVRGEINQLNNRARKLLLIKEENVIGMLLKDTIPCMVNVAKSVQKGLADTMEVTCEDGDAMENLNITIHPYYNNRKEYEGSILIVQKRERVFDLVNKITGAQAEFSFKSIIGKNENFMKAKEIAATAATSNSTVLLLGESGTGKELFAQAIHNASKKKGPFIAVNCSAIPRSLIESELFGYEAGSFTGANRNGRPGKFERAQHGTIFLDEIGDMPLDLQAILLRVLQEKEIVRVGGYRPIPIDARVIAATNQDLVNRVKEGAFREDLFFRLNVITVNIPPLRERKDDIPLLVGALLPQVTKNSQKNITSISTGAMRALKAYDWPGNVRELENVLERSVLLAEGNQLSVNDLPKNVLDLTHQIEERTTKVITLQEAEKMAISHALEQKKSIVDASTALGISRSTLYRKMKEYGLDQMEM
ncbi:sigma-54-dependent Fis family transcriptional regulator [Dehalobacterium formicoaceticum]|uniref:sigma-54-dependent Fis family transcriptional regulator n=1 Tax=Dehalobacterium formicoaceticum TaxID=51515 RepID=UPI000B7CD4E7|nr:sigma-54-dependent Fis family transcriptional regulator [Dehalobacterium formicoaceticum]